MSFICNASILRRSRVGRISLPKVQSVCRILQMALRRNPAPFDETGDNAFLPCPGDHLPAFSRTLPPDRAALRGIAGEACHRKEGPGGRRREKDRVRASSGRGISLTRRNLRPRLTSSDYLNLEEGRTALREVSRQIAPQTRSE